MWKRILFISTTVIVLACTGLLQAQSDPLTSDDSSPKSRAPYKPAILSPSDPLASNDPSSKPRAPYIPHTPSPSLSPRTTATRLYMTMPDHQPTYKVKSTKPYSGEDLNTSNLQTIERTKSAKEKFLRMRGFKSLPPGYKVDYIVPLSQGGRDAPENMQLVPEIPQEQKTAGKGRSR